MGSPITVQVVAEDLTRRERECLERAIQTVNGLQSQLLVLESIRPITLPHKRGILKENTAFDALDRRQKQDRIFCVTRKVFKHNYFQTTDERCSLMTIADWEDEYAPPSLQTYIVYEFAFAFIVWAADHVGKKALIHKKTLGCRMDFCRDKNDLKLGMIAGYICPECRRHLRQLDATPKQIAAIERILSHVQLVSKGEGEPPDDWNTAFVVMRFSENDDNQTAFEKGIKPGLRDVGLTAQRADDQIESRPLLEKITQQILRSRFIIAKVDAERMNIYYELGLAMGRKKDVLLVSEQSLVKKLPSDLSNWECLTYPKGDYAELRRKIAKFYRDNYHLARSTAPPASQSRDTKRRPP